MFGSKKLGGILTELSAETDEVRFVIIGIGLNVNNTKNSLVEAATSLKEARGENLNRLELLQEILCRIEYNYAHLEEKAKPDIIEKWRSFNATLGKRVKVICQRHEVEGQAIDIDSDGGLLVRRDSGLTEKVMSGDVVFSR